MIQIERYLFRTATTACVSGLVVLTGVVWVTQALTADRPDHQQRPDHSDLPDDDGTDAAFAGGHHRACRAVCRDPLHPQQAQRRQRARRHGGFRRVAATAVAADGAPVGNRVCGCGGALHPGPAVEFWRNRDPDDLRSRRLHRQFRPSRRFFSARDRVRVSFSRPHARRGAARRIHAGYARSGQSDDLYRGGGKNGRS